MYGLCVHFCLLSSLLQQVDVLADLLDSATEYVTLCSMFLAKLSSQLVPVEGDCEALHEVGGDLRPAHHLEPLLVVGGAGGVLHAVPHLLCNTRDHGDTSTALVVQDQGTRNKGHTITQTYSWTE